MILKHIYSKKKEKILELIDKKYLNKEFYGKFLIRNSVSENFNLYVLDNNNSFFNLPGIKLNKFIKVNEQYKFLGRSLIGKEFEYKNKLNRYLTIKIFLINNKSQKRLPLLNSLFNLLKITKKNYKGALILLNPKKGGFNCYSEGVFGFMPRSHATFLFSKTLNFFGKFKTNQKASNLNFLLRKDTFIKKNLLIRLSNWWGKITLFPRTTKDKFSINSRKRRKRFFSNKINFVFLTKKNRYFKLKIKKSK